MQSCRLIYVRSSLVSVQWKRLPVSNEPPLPRAYHSMNCIGSRYLLFGGFDGKSTFGDLWWLVPEEDPIAKRLPLSPSSILESKTLSTSGASPPSPPKANKKEESPVVELQRRLGITVSASKPEISVGNELEDKELIELASNIASEQFSSLDETARIQALREHWKMSAATSIRLRELGPLLRDYQRLIIQHLSNKESESDGTVLNLIETRTFRFFHLKSSSQLRMDDIPKLLNEYKQLQTSLG